MRIESLDRLRGLAIVIMIVDHVAGGVGGLEWFRLTATRTALPLFMLVSGYLLAGRDHPSFKRWGQLLGAAAMASVLVSSLPWMAPVDTLAVFVVAVLAWAVARRWPAGTVVVCVVAMATFPRVWPGYHPAEFVALMAMGPRLLVEGSWLRGFGERLPGVLGFVGRWPLSWYVGHLAVLVVLVGVFV